MMNWTGAGLVMDMVGVVALGLVIPEYAVWRVGTASLGFKSRLGHSLFVAAWVLIVLGFGAQLLGALRPLGTKSSQESAVTANRFVLVRADGSVGGELRSDSSGATLTLVGQQQSRFTVGPSELRFVDSAGRLRTSMGFQAERPFVALHDTVGDPRLLATLAPNSRVSLAYYAAKGAPLMSLTNDGTRWDFTFWDLNRGAYRPLWQRAR